MISKLKYSIIDFVATIAMWLLIYLDDIIDTIVTCVVSAGVCLIMVNYVFMPIQVDGTSMYPQLKDKQIGFSNIISKKTNGVDRFDIVVIYLADRDENLVKRVIGLPGETVMYIGDTLYINDQVVKETFFDEEYVKEQTEFSYIGQFTNDFTITLGEDEYFCMGDNRLVSLDSRYYGPFHLEQIKSKDIFVVYPFNQFGKAN